MSDIHILTIPYDGLHDDQLPAFRVPAQYGGITIIDAATHITGTANITLITMTNVGTPVANGTIAAAVGGTAAAGVPYAFTIASPFVAAGLWVGIQENNIGTPTAAHVTISYVVGK